MARRWVGAVLFVVVFCGAGTARAQPDLDMVWWAIAPASVQGAGSLVTINYGVRNNGTSACGNFYLGFYYGDSTSTTDLTFMGQAYLPGMVDGESGYYTSVVAMPTMALKGSRYIHYFIDHAGDVAESNENNNRDHEAISVTGDPDVQVDVLSVTPTTAAPGATLDVTYRLYNDGPTRAAVPFYLRFYHSPNSSITTADTYLGQQITVSSLPAQSYHPGSANGATTVTLPGATAPGSSYIGAIADYNDLIAESAENNNTRSTPITVVAPAELAMQSFSANVATVPGSGSQVQISFEVQNSGAGAAGAFVVRFYYGDTAATTGLTLLATRNISGLAAGAGTGTLTEMVSMPASVLFGTRYLHYFVDADGQVPETNESNNRGSETLGITGRPDLQLSNLALSPTSAPPGATLTVSYRLLNAGLSRVPATFYTRLYYSPDSAITMSDTYLGQQIAVTALLAGAEHPPGGDGSAGVTLPAGAAMGTRYIGGITDYSNAVVETTETNNSKAAPVLVVGNTGAPCAVANQCSSGYCVDGVCCNTACGGGVASDCQACSTGAGAPQNGSCSLLPPTKVCRAAAGLCDEAETCSGASAACPANLFKPTTALCRPAAGLCDLAESCNGSSACPANAFEPAGVVCRPAAGGCDLAEQCVGGMAACPADLYQPNGAPCSGGMCVGGNCVPVPDSGPPDFGADLGVPDAGSDAAPDAAGVDSSSDAAPADASTPVEGGPDGSAPDGSAAVDAAATGDGPVPLLEAGAHEGGPDGPTYNPPELEEGCACALGAAPPPAVPLVLLVLALLLALRVRARD